METVQYFPIEVKGNKVSWEGRNPRALTGKSVLLLDGSIHSGRMMSMCADEVAKRRPSALSSYALVLKSQSCFIPTAWGVMTAESDRSYFLLDDIPNNRLDAGKGPQPLVHMRKLNTSHLDQPRPRSGLKSIDRVTWSDRYFQMQASDDTCTYVLEKASRIVGFLTVQRSEPRVLSIAEVVVRSRSRGYGYGGILVRFAETLARQNDCQLIRLNAIRNRVRWYKKESYRPSLTKEPILIDDEAYVPMEKPVLHHQPGLPLEFLR